MCIWPGYLRPVIVRRDAHGVPHIEAATEDDHLVAQGYVTAQDRLWQMDASRRSANGNLAEILGPALLTARQDAARS
jgi:penicillin amidase